MSEEEKQYLSKEKFDELTKELEFLRTQKRKEVAEKLEFAKSLGDLSENAEYQEARDEQAAVEDRISTLENILKSAEIVSKAHSKTVKIGSTVTIRKKGAKDAVTYQIVGTEEADSTAGKISNKSPIGSSLIGKSKGEEVTVQTPAGTVVYTIENIS